MEREEAARLRRLAEECRRLAQTMSLRKHAQMLLDMAQQYEAEAQGLEVRAATEAGAAIERHKSPSDP